MYEQKCEHDIGYLKGLPCHVCKEVSNEPEKIREELHDLLHSLLHNIENCSMCKEDQILAKTTPSRNETK